MAALLPFRALRPRPDEAARVAAPPYDVVDEAEAAALAKGRPHSFLHVTRPEIDLAGPDGAPADPHSDAAYAASRAALDALVTDGVLVPDATATYTVYAAPAADGSGGVQVGVVGLVSAAEYRAGVVRTHEHTRPDKLEDRRRHIEAVGGHDEPVLLLAPPDAAVDRVLAEVTATAPDVDVPDAVDGGSFRLWVVADDAHVTALRQAFAAMPDLYVADGHHRSEAAALVHDARLGDGTPQHGAHWFPALVIPADRACVLPYDRLVRDLGGHTPADVLALVDDHWAVTRSGVPVRPAARGEVGLYLDGAWYRLVLRPGVVPADADPVVRLDVHVLQASVLDPVLGITDPRTDPRIGFVGGRTPGELAAMVDAGRAACAFALCPTSPHDVMAVARSGAVMPPKSTWFAPKPYSGLFVHRYG